MLDRPGPAAAATRGSSGACYADDRIELYAGGRDDVKLRAGRPPRAAPPSPTSPSPACGRSVVQPRSAAAAYYTSSGNVSRRSRPQIAVDVAQYQRHPILGHQEPGGVGRADCPAADAPPGHDRPHQIISLLDSVDQHMAMADHRGPHPRRLLARCSASNRKPASTALAVLKPGQWSDLMRRLRHIDQPRLARRDSGNAGHRIPIAETHRPRDAAAADAARASEPRPRRRIDPHAGAALEPAKRRQLCQRVIGDGRISTKVAPPAQVCVYCTRKEGPRSQRRRGRRREAGNRSRDGPRAPPSRDRPACDRPRIAPRRPPVRVRLAPLFQPPGRPGALRSRR